MVANYTYYYSQFSFLVFFYTYWTATNSTSLTNPN